MRMMSNEIWAIHAGARSRSFQAARSCLAWSRWFTMATLLHALQFDDVIGENGTIRQSRARIRNAKTTVTAPYDGASETDIGEDGAPDFERQYRRIHSRRDRLPAIGETTHSERRDCTAPTSGHRPPPPPGAVYSVGCWNRVKEARTKPPTWGQQGHQLMTAPNTPKGDALISWRPESQEKPHLHDEDTSGPVEKPGRRARTFVLT